MKLCDLLDKLVELIKTHPKKAISLAVLIGGLISPQCQKTVEAITQILAEQPTVEVQKPSSAPEAK